MKYPFLIIGLLTCYISFGQKKTKPIVKIKSKTVSVDTTKFMGIGVFKIGSDTSVLFDHAKQNIKDIFFLVDQTRELNNRWYLVPKSPDLKMYYLNRYKIADLTIKNAVLTYYKGKLAQFNCDYSFDLSDAMEQKYGKPIFETQYKDCECLYNLTGVIRKLREEIYIYKWSNGPISGYSTITKKYDTHCKEIGDAKFTFESKDIDVLFIDFKYQAAHPITAKKMSLEGF